MHARRPPVEHVVPSAPGPEYRVAIGGAVGHGRVGNACLVLHSRPVRAARGTDVVLVQRRRAMPAGRRVVEVVSLRVAVPAEQQHMREVVEQREQPLAVRVPEGVAPRRLEQRDVHAHHQQPRARQRRQVGLQERELVLAEPADVGGAGVRSHDHVVQQHVGRPLLFPGVGVRAEVPAVGIQRVRIRGRADVHVVVAGHEEPRHPRTQCRDQRGMQRRVVVGEVAQHDAQVGRRTFHRPPPSAGVDRESVGVIGTDGVHHVAAEVVGIRGRFQLRIRHHDDGRAAGPVQVAVRMPDGEIPALTG